MQTETFGGGACARRRLLAATALVSLALLPVAPRGADAQTVWDGSSSSDWNTAANWDTNAVPTAADTVNIGTSTPNATEIDNFAAVSNDLYIYGTGALSIVNAGSLNASGTVEVGAGGAGASLSLDTNSTLTSATSLVVGGFGTGTLSIAGGSGAGSLSGTIGNNVGSVGTATVTGSGSTWTTTNQLDVGYRGQGTLLIQNGGAVTAGGNVHLGYFATGVGTVTVDGAGSSLAAVGFAVGEDGQGTLNVTNGGAITSIVGNVGASAGSSGTATVDGAGSIWTVTTSLSVGNGGQGSLTIQNGGVVGSANVTLGYVAGGVGTATVDGVGSSLAAANLLVVGDEGQGTLTIQNGGAATAGMNVYLGSVSGGVGTATVDGAGSTLTAVSSLVVGEGGQGTLNVINGGDVTSADGAVGSSSGSSGIATINGAGSTWSVANELYVGDAGQGTLTIQNGGAVSAGMNVYLGNDATGVGTATVDGAGSTLTAGSSLAVGTFGQGTLNVTNGGAVTSFVGYIGATGGSSGTATVDGAGSTWTNTNVLYVGNDGQGTLTIRNGGAVTASAVTIAGSAGSTGTLNIGNGGAAGTLNTASVTFGGGTGAINFNHTDTGYTFASMISGLGVINHLAGTTLLTGDSSGFIGTTSVTGGGLYVNGMLGGTTNVTGGTLGGTGTLTGPLTVGAGGNVAPGNPGNSIGTLTVAAATFNAGSTYTVKLDDAGNAAGVNNGLLNATGAVTVNGGTVHVTPANGTDTGTTYALGTVYTIVTAAGGVSGTFAAVTDDYAFLDFTASYDASNVFLTSQMGAASFCLPGMTANQCATGNGVFSLGAGSLYTAVLNLSNAEAPFALDQLSGEIHASAQSALIEDSRFVREAALNRVRSAFDGVAAGPMAAFAYAPGGLQPAAADTDRFAIWGHAFGAFGHFDGDGNAARLGRSIGGLFIGGDTAVGDHWRIGALGGYSRSRFDVDALASSGTSDNYHLGVYGGGEWGAFGFRYGGAYAWHDLHTARHVAFSGFADKLSADYRAGTGQVFGDVGYRLRAGGVRYEPFANLAYVNLHTDGFTETGGAAALVAASRSTDTAFTTLGVRAQTSLFASSGETTLRGTLGWRHAYGDVVPTSAMTFAAGGDAFLIAGVPIARNALVFDAGLDIKLRPAATLGVSYSGQFGSGVTDQGMKANLAVKF